MDMNTVVGSHDLLFITLDTLRYDVAEELAATGRTPHLSALLPGGRWEPRHSPASFTYAAHHAFFAGFLPTPA
ncbi:metalloenzyme domain-containing protein, partial [Pyxidicoccus fallax]|nr:metalloenzyme domain-containing protein [Pyxidicoccus fallax]